MSQDTPKNNKETGEVIEQKNYDIVAEMFTDQVLDMYYQYQALQEAKEQFEHKVLKACKKYGVKKIDNEYFSITYVGEHPTRKVDTELLKKAGYYDKFLKESPVKESIRIKIK